MSADTSAPATEEPRSDLILAGLPGHTNEQACFDGKRGYWVQTDCVLIEADDAATAIAQFRHKMANSGQIACNHNFGTSAIRLLQQRHHASRPVAAEAAPIPISEREPVFPCWIFNPNSDKGRGMWFHMLENRLCLTDTHWLPDQPVAPTARPSQPAAPDVAALAETFKNYNWPEGADETKSAFLAYPQFSQDHFGYRLVKITFAWSMDLARNALRTALTALVSERDE